MNKVGPSAGDGPRRWLSRLGEYVTVCLVRYKTTLTQSARKTASSSRRPRPAAHAVADSLAGPTAHRRRLNRSAADKRWAQMYGLENPNVMAALTASALVYGRAALNCL